LWYRFWPHSWGRAGGWCGLDAVVGEHAGIGCECGERTVLAIGVDLEKVAPLRRDDPDTKQGAIAKFVQQCHFCGVGVIEIDRGHKGATARQYPGAGRKISEPVRLLLCGLDHAKTRPLIEFRVDPAHGANRRQVLGHGGDAPRGDVEGTRQLACEQFQRGERVRRPVLVE
jgi:hypothetical protein